MSKELQCKCCKEYWWETNIHSTSGLCPICYDYMSSLEAKLAESEARAERNKVWHNEVAGECAELKQQLANKEKEIESYEHELEVYKQNDNVYARNMNRLANRFNQDKISFAVDKLVCVFKNI